MSERRRETEKERERDREREGGVKQMCQDCIPTMNMNTLCYKAVDSFFFARVHLFIFNNLHLGLLMV